MGACCSHRAQRLCAGGDEMKLSPWFHVGKYGAPVNLGWYDFERRNQGRRSRPAGLTGYATNNERVNDE